MMYSHHDITVRVELQSGQSREYISPAWISELLAREDMLNHTSKDLRPAQKVDGTSLVMGYTEAAEFLGLSPRTLERYVREGRIPYVPLPKRGTWSGVRFLRHQLLRWLEGRTVKPARANRVTSS